MANTTYYYEPNDLEYNAEDLCLGVDLKVEYYSRALNGSRKMEGNVFFGGNNDLLTTSYSDVTILELEGGGNKESIGIESINIKYNSWYFPEVNIKFIDIRGNSIFNSMEMANDKKPKPTNEDSFTEPRAKGSFLKAFFTFPYPMFQLTVKGYFGQPVTYRLTVKDVPKATFNSSTGNFEMSVNFIGHMYYYLTDIPMSLIMAAPYIQYGDNKKDLEGGLPTLVELLKQLNSALTNLNDDPRTNETEMAMSRKNQELEDVGKVLNELQNLNEIISRLFDITNTDEDNRRRLTLKTNASITDSGFENIGKLIEYMYGIKGKLLGHYNNNDFINSLIVSKNGTNNTPSSHETAFIYYYNYDNDKRLIDSKKEEIREEIRTLQSEQEANIERVMQDAFKDSLTLEKLIAIVLAHLKKFHQNVKQCMVDIGKQGENTKLRNSHNYDCRTDCNVKNDANITLYPFTGFLNKNNEYIWISNIKNRHGVNANIDDFVERVFVDRVLEGVSEFQNEMDEIIQEFEVESGGGDFPRLGLYGILMDIKNAATDYYKTQMAANGGLANYCKVNDTNTLPPVFKDLAKRTVLSYVFCGKDYTQNTFGGVEGLKLLKQGFNRDVYSPTTLWGSLENSNMRVNELFFNLVKEEYKKFMIEFCNPQIHRSERIFDARNGGLLGASVDKKTYTCLEHEIDFYYYYNIRLTAENNSMVSQTEDKANFVIPKNFIDIDLQTYKTNVDECKNYIKRKFSNDDTQYGNVFDGDFNLSNLRGISKDNTDDYRNELENFVDNNDTPIKFNLNYSDGDYNLGNLDGLNIKKFKRVKDGNFDISSKILNEVDDGNCIANFWGLFKKSLDQRKIVEMFHLGGSIILNKLSVMYLGYIIDTENTLENSDPYYKIIFNSSIGELVKNYYNTNKSSFADSIRDCFGGNTGDLNDIQRGILKNIIKETACFLSPCKMDEPDKVNFYTSYGNDRQIEEFNGQIEERMSDVRFAQNDVIEKFLKIFNNEVGGDNTNNGKIKSIIDEDDSKRLAVYDIFKHLYDRWKYGADNSMKHDITVNDFVFRDTLNRSISNLTINIDKLSKLLLSIKQGETDMSLYQFLFDVCNISDCLLLPLPLNVYDTIDSNDKIEKIFTPYDYSYVRDSEISSKFVVTYRQKDSQFLNFSAEESEYADDGFDFTNDDVEKTTDMKKIRAFGVTYGLGNQRYFKDIQVSMDKPMVTEHSIASTMYIAENGGKKGGTKFGMVYQDVFDTYSNHSYQCTVEMMGDMQIMPMMYFQLNNVPLFKGGYMITSVEHNITNQGMKTNFTGTRVNKNHFQYARNEVKAKKKRRTTNNSSSTNNNTNSTPQTNADEYTKDNSIIVIEAGLAMDYGVGSNGPIVDIINVNPESFESPNIYNNDGYFGDVEPESKVKDKGNDNGILYPFSKDGVQSGNMLYRQYWGNIKIADELYNKLKGLGYKVSKSYQSDINSKISTKPRITTGEELNGKKVIILNLHGNTLSNMKPMSWNSGNYCQFFYQNAGDSAATHTNTSKKLAKCLETKFKEFFEGIDLKVNNKKVEIKASAEINTNIDDKRGIVGYAAPAVLCKTLFSDTKEHVKFLTKKDNRTALVNAYVNGIEKFFNESNHERRPRGQGLAMDATPVYEGSNYTWWDMTGNSYVINAGFNNIPSEEHQNNLHELCEKLLDPICEKWGKKVSVTCAYRCRAYNDTLKKAVKNSQHIYGEAADIFDSGGKQRELWDTICSLVWEGKIVTGQLLWEYGSRNKPSWIHISLPTRNDRNKIRRVLTVNGREVWDNPPGSQPPQSNS